MLLSLPLLKAPVSRALASPPPPLPHQAATVPHLLPLGLSFHPPGVFAFWVHDEHLLCVPALTLSVFCLPTLTESKGGATEWDTGKFSSSSEFSPDFILVG